LPISDYAAYVTCSLRSCNEADASIITRPVLDGDLR
jgi:hypothetical protein